MKATHTFSTTVSCTVSQPTISTLQGEPLIHLQVEVPIALSADISFTDAVAGELIKLLTPLGLTIRTCFYIQSQATGQTIQLGTVHLTTIADVFTYRATLTLESPGELSLFSAETCQVGAIVQVSSSSIPTPSLMRGCIEVEMSAKPVMLDPLADFPAPLAVTQPKVCRKRGSRSQNT